MDGERESAEFRGMRKTRLAVSVRPYVNDARRDGNVSMWGMHHGMTRDVKRGKFACNTSRWPSSRRRRDDACAVHCRCVV
jgi:hypothetical protein